MRGCVGAYESAELREMCEVCVCRYDDISDYVPARACVCACVSLCVRVTSCSVRAECDCVDICVVDKTFLPENHGEHLLR